MALAKSSFVRSSLALKGIGELLKVESLFDVVTDRLLMNVACETMLRLLEFISR